MAWPWRPSPVLTLVTRCNQSPAVVSLLSTLLTSWITANTLIDNIASHVGQFPDNLQNTLQIVFLLGLYNFNPLSYFSDSFNPSIRTWDFELTLRTFEFQTWDLGLKLIHSSNQLFYISERIPRQRKHKWGPSLSLLAPTSHLAPDSLCLRLRPVNCRRSCIEVGRTRTLDDRTPACPQHWVLCQSPLCQIIRCRENEVSCLYHRPFYVPKGDKGRASWTEASERPLHVLRCQVGENLANFFATVFIILSC